MHLQFHARGNKLGCQFINFASSQVKTYVFWGQADEKNQKQRVHHGLNVYREFAFVSCQHFTTASQFLGELK